MKKLATTPTDARRSQFSDLEQLLQGDLHAFLGKLLERCNQVSRAVQDQYSLH